MSALSNIYGLEDAGTTWHVPATLGVIVGGIGMSYWLHNNKRARTGGGELSGFRRRGRSSRGKRCTRFKNTRSGRRCARFR